MIYFCYLISLLLSGCKDNESRGDIWKEQEIKNFFIMYIYLFLFTFLGVVYISYIHYKIYCIYLYK
ncbi:hypothetical protein IY41_06260 [Phocaeicola dorei]|uniref:Lipoprotein n=2 Tax=Phocaeicola dorei TaxID=357276 RepID=B6VXG9_9BACT|nr:MAG: hypothetical protein GV66_05905 [Phocaeicola dorei]EEB25528.1 hypothetical protein BACDOR_01977 [Phocaeicola dorei DSM 17855]EEZ21407.1 hypothetical protein HMPREF0105_1960 [Bacteroides sp. 3_1_33FAA]ALA73120.1 hypothetical protein IY41_06260 [Phocaeicola dorei]TDB03519.1 hypothetical protein E1J06_20325 [Phocaeicola dorei]